MLGDGGVYTSWFQFSKTRDSVLPTHFGERYADEWRRQFTPRLRLAAAFAHLAMRPGLASPLLALLGRWPSLLTEAARWGGKARCALSTATIAWLAAGAGSPRPQSLRQTPQQARLEKPAR